MKQKLVASPGPNRELMENYLISKLIKRHSEPSRHNFMFLYHRATLPPVPEPPTIAPEVKQHLWGLDIAL